MFLEYLVFRLELQLMFHYLLDKFLAFRLCIHTLDICTFFIGPFAIFFNHKETNCINNYATFYLFYFNIFFLKMQPLIINFKNYFTTKQKPRIISSVFLLPLCNALRTVNWELMMVEISKLSFVK